MSSSFSGSGTSFDVPDRICDLAKTIGPVAESLFDAVQQTVNSVGWLIQAGAKVLAAFGVPGADTVVRAVDDIRNFVNRVGEFLGVLAEVIKGVAMPWLLPEYADKWAEISNRTGVVAQTLGPQDLRAPGAQDWTGEAAEAYRALARKYVETAEFASETAMEHSQRLDVAAKEGQDLYCALFGFLQALVSFITSMTFKASNILTLAFAVIEVITNGIELLNKTIEAVQALLDFAKNQNQAFQEITAALAAAEHYFPGGTWPRPTI